MKCEILPTDHHRDFGRTEGCTHPAGHYGPHLCKAERHGPIEWRYDYECGCCDGSEPDGCTIWWRLA